LEDFLHGKIEKRIVLEISKDKILYKKNNTFSIKHITTSVDELDMAIKNIESGACFSDILLSKDELIDIIDINYLQNKDVLHIILHFAIIELN